MEISVQDSPLPNALNVYFSFIRELARPTATDKLALNSTLITFDIVERGTLYTENVFRGFVDRKVTLSPSDVGFGAADIGDRYSFLYKFVLETVVSQIDRRLDAEDREELRLYKDDLREAEGELDETYADMTTRWLEHMRREGITQDDPEYLEKQVAFYNTFGFASKIRRLTGDIAQAHEDMRGVRVRAYPDDEARLLAYFYRNTALAEKEMARPNRPELEAVRGYNELQLAQMWIYGNLGAVFDSSVEIFPSGFLKYFVEREGRRAISITRTSSSQYQHDEEWQTSGSATYKFFKIDADVEYERHLKESLDRAVGIEISFENMAEYLVRRGDWYSSSVYDTERLKEYFEDHPQQAVDLSYVITSVILGRGMQVKYTFSSAESFEYWDRLDVETDASFSVFGMNIPSGQADYNGYTMRKRVDTQSKTVTFYDDPKHCRLLAFRVEKVIDVDNGFRNFRLRNWEETIPDALAQVRYGKLTYSELLAQIEEHTRQAMSAYKTQDKPPSRLF